VGKEGSKKIGAKAKVGAIPQQTGSNGGSGKSWPTPGQRHELRWPEADKVPGALGTARTTQGAQKGKRRVMTKPKKGHFFTKRSLKTQGRSKKNQWASKENVY